MNPTVARNASLIAASGRSSRIAVTDPYMHDGRFATLDAVIDHYARGGTPGPNRSPLVRGFSITGEEKRDLVAFLKSLTGEESLKDPRFSDPWNSRPFGYEPNELPGCSIPRQKTRALSEARNKVDLKTLKVRGWLAHRRSRAVLKRCPSRSNHLISPSRSARATASVLECTCSFS